MKILVTGYKGFIGAHMMRSIPSAHTVIGYDWEDGTRPSVKDFDWVIHLGAISSTVDRNVERIFKQNYDFSVELFDECKYHHVNLQYASSASVYGLGQDFRESAPVDPRTPYAWSKYLFERYHQKNQGTNIVQGFRYFNVFGPQGEEHKGSQASPHSQFAQEFKSTGKVTVFQGSENYYRDFVSVFRVCQTHFDFFNVKESGIWNVGSGTPQSFMDIAKSITNNIATRPMPENLWNSYQRYTCADMTHTNQTLDRWRQIGKVN